jgi:hypothetical protein
MWGALRRGWSRTGPQQSASTECSRWRSPWWILEGGRNANMLPQGLPPPHHAHYGGGATCPTWRGMGNANVKVPAHREQIVSALPSKLSPGRTPRRRATMTACARLRALSLRKMALMCVFTVSVARRVSRAISLLRSPESNSRKISSSHGVSFPHLIRTAIRDATNGARAHPPS